MSDSFNIENFPSSESAIKMLSYVSDGFYDNSYVGKWLYQVMGLEHDSVMNVLETLPDQMFPETATWGLFYHEIKWGLPVRESLSYEERRKLIYQKRDYRAPMTPYRMEVMLSDLSGCNVYINDIHQPGDDGYIPGHPNKFRVTLEVGTNQVNLGDILTKLNKIKQSHTTYDFRVTTKLGLYVFAKGVPWRVHYVPCGTYPKVSTGWRLLKDRIDFDINSASFINEPPLSGTIEAGRYPKTSRGLGIGRDTINLDLSRKTDKLNLVLSGEGETGQYPKTSTGYGISRNNVEIEVESKGDCTDNAIAGTIPDISTRLANSENAVLQEVTGVGTKVAYQMCGSAFII